MALNYDTSELANLLFYEHVLDVWKVLEKTSNDLVNAIVEVDGLLDLRFFCFLLLNKRSIGMM